MVKSTVMRAPLPVPQRKKSWAAEYMEVLWHRRHRSSREISSLRRRKGRVLNWPGSPFATGDEENFLGSGAIGLKPFAVFSYKGRVSPHALAGSELNGSSLLCGNYVATRSNTKSPQPSRLLYIAGADVAPTKRITVAFDICGQRLYGTSELRSSEFTDFGACNDSNCAVVTLERPIPLCCSNGKRI